MIYEYNSNDKTKYFNYLLFLKNSLIIKVFIDNLEISGTFDITVDFPVDLNPYNAFCCFVISKTRNMLLCPQNEYSQCFPDKRNVDSFSFGLCVCQ